MLCFAVEGDEVVQGSVYGASPQPVGNCPKAEGKEAIGKRKTKKGKGGHGNAAHGDAACAEPLDDPMAHKAGQDGAGGNDKGNDATQRKGNPQTFLHLGPCGTQKRIRQPQ